MRKEYQGLTTRCIVYDVLMVGGFVAANHYSAERLLSAFLWLFYLVAAISILGMLFGLKTTYFYSKVKFHYEIASTILFGLVLAFYGHYALASILTFTSVCYTQMAYFSGKQREDNNEN